MSLSAPRLAGADEAPTVGDEVRRERRADSGSRNVDWSVTSKSSIDLVEGSMRDEETLDARLLALGNLLDGEHDEECHGSSTARSQLADELAPHGAGVGQVASLEQAVETGIGHVHAGVLGKMWR